MSGALRRTTRAALMAVMAVAAAACGPEEPREADHGPAASGGAHEGAEGARHEDEVPTVRIDPAMLRDLRMTTSAAESRGGGEEVIALGEASVNEDAYAEAGPPIPSRVTNLMVSQGDRVRAGQPLAELQSAELGQARAAFMEAEARAVLARRTLERKRSLGAERIVPPREVQEAEAEAGAAEASVRAARARLLAMGLPSGEIPGGQADDVSRFLLRAPIGGVVLERRAVLGQAVEPGLPLYRIAETSRLWVIVQVFERDALRVERGATARVVFAALPGRSFAGTVARIAGQVDSSARTIPVRVDLPNDEGLIRPGMSATAFLTLRDRGAPIVAVPSAAMQRLDEEWCVFIPRQDGVFEIRPVGRGRDLGGEVEVVSGLGAGEVVVVEGAFLIKAQAEKARGGGEEHDH